MKMKSATILVSMLACAMSVQAVSLNNKSSQRRYITPEEVHVTVSPAAKQKAESIYNSVRSTYSQGKLSADGVVDKALYHGVWSPELAARCLQLVSDKSNRAKAELGYLYTFNKTAYMFPNKQAEGLRLMEAAANAGNKKADSYLGIYYDNKKDYGKAWKYFNAAGNENTPFALEVMGEMYEKGHGVKKDYAKAREYYRQASMLGDANGAAKYGSVLQRQWFGKVNMPDAFFWTYLAGEFGNDVARSNLQLPLRGERFGDDKNTAFILNSLTLVDGFNDEVGHPLREEPIYKEGYAAGLAPRTVSAEKGDEWSLFYLGSMSYNDEFLNHSGDFIRKCYEPIIATGKLPKRAMALVYERMADLYRKGDGVKANAAKANEYARKAADLGSLAAYKIVEHIPD
ncbi:MAG: sel1 repeat family protein [Bacteroides sp.]|nr:sel1 repeat family protein [Bacteroides sp.]